MSTEPRRTPAWHSYAAWRKDAVQVLRDEADGATAMAGHGGALPGTCGLCGGSVVSATGSVNPREGLHCAGCGCNARQRAAAMVMLDELQASRHARVLATEQASPLFVALRRRLPGLQGSEYAPNLLRRLRLSSWLWRHGVAGWVRHGDATALRFRDGSLDGVISLDVLEHVPDHHSALREFGRVLKPGGVLVLTVPFYENNVESAQIARLRVDGGIEHLGEPEYHGDPLGGGVACFHHFGWSLCDDIGEAGFHTATVCRVRDPARGLPHGQWVFRAQR